MTDQSLTVYHYTEHIGTTTFALVSSIFSNWIKKDGDLSENIQHAIDALRNALYTQSQVASILDKRSGFWVNIGKLNTNVMYFVDLRVVLATLNYTDGVEYESVHELDDLAAKAHQNLKEIICSSTFERIVVKWDPAK